MMKLDFEQCQRAEALVEFLGDNPDECAYEIIGLRDENEALRARLDKAAVPEEIFTFIKQLRDIAFSLPAPNSVTPRIMMNCDHAERYFRNMEAAAPKQEDKT